MPKVVLQCPPNYFDVANQKNPDTTRKAAADRAKTRSQWKYVCGVFQQSRLSSIKKIDMAILAKKHDDSSASHS